VRALKILVVVMGIMLVGGFATLVAMIAKRVSDKGAAPPAAAPAAPFAAAPIDLPAGTQIDTMAVGADRLILNVIAPDGRRELLVIDLASGRRLGTIPLHVSQ
jgi:hypothetical protein